MALKKFVKIDKITNLSDARYCAGMMVDVLGFNLKEGTDGYISPQVFGEITKWVAGVNFAGEFDDLLPSIISKTAEHYPLNLIETTNPNHLAQLKDLNIPVILKIQVDRLNIGSLESQLQFDRELVQYITIDCRDVSLHNQIEEISKRYRNELKMLRAFGNTMENMKIIGDHWFGIQLKGTPEDRPGYNDYGQVMDILETLEED